MVLRPHDAESLTDDYRLRCSLNSVLDVSNGVLYLAVSVPDPREGQTTVVTVLQDAAGEQLDVFATVCAAVYAVPGQAMVVACPCRQSAVGMHVYGHQRSGFDACMRNQHGAPAGHPSRALDIITTVMPYQIMSTKPWDWSSFECHST